MKRLCEIIAFDLDGTLVDTAGLHVAATQAASHEVFGEDAPTDRVARSLGHPVTESMRIISNGRQHIPELLTAFMGYYAAHEHEGAQCFPPTLAVLERLRDAGIGLALLSNKLRQWGMAEIDRLGLTPFFRRVVFAEDMPMPKPSGLALRPVLETFRIAPKAVLVIGDSAADIACANAAGAQSGAALWGAHDPTPTLAAHPMHTFATMEAVLTLLGL